MADKMMRRVRSDLPWANDLNRWADLFLGNTPGRIKLWGDGGNELDLIDGTVVSANNYPLDVRSDVGYHGRFRNAADTADVLFIRDSGITATVPAVFNGNVTIGDAAGDTLTVNATSTFVAPASFNGNVTLGDAAGDTITINGTSTFAAAATFAAALTANGTVTINSGTTINDQLVVNGNITVGGTGRRILGNFSAGAVTDRTAFQSATTNGLTSVVAMPNGTSTVSAFAAWNNPSGSTAGTNGAVQLAVSGASSFVQVLGGVTALSLNIGGTNQITVSATGIGFFATTPAAQPAAAAAATDLASVITLANSLRTGLRGATGLGLFS